MDPFEIHTEKKMNKQVFETDVLEHENNVSNQNEHFENDDRKLVCTSCDYQANRKGDLQAHIMNIHEGVKFPCTVCDYQANRKCDLQVHMRVTHYGAQDNLTPCSICGSIEVAHKNYGVDCCKSCK